MFNMFSIKIFLFCSSGMDCNTINGIATCVDPCTNYTVLNDAWRSVLNTDSSNLHCDNEIKRNTWHRMFLGENNAQIPNTCVGQIFRCGTAAPLWINGAHPTQADGIVSRPVCGYWSGSCCFYSSNPIKAKLCYGSYYVYKLDTASTCWLAYCTGTVIFQSIEGIVEMCFK
uniref:UMOD/GP2/OIT3-like D8C domain-containing protein n=1 Tax=Oryzias latipes TaxID=8090 RepID=A0A3P9L428_ORYLA